MKANADQPLIVTDKTKDGLEGSRVEKWAIIPGRAGTIKIPEVSVYWWDVQQDKTRIAVIPAKMIEVLPANNEIPDSLVNQDKLTEKDKDTVLISEKPISTTDNQSAFWKALAIVFAILWSATILLWLLYKNKNAAKDIENVVNNKRNQAHEIKSATKNVENALITGEAEIIQDALLKWAGSLWSENPPLGIEQIGERIPELKNGIKSLNSLLYGNQDKEDSLEDLQKKFCRLSLTAKKNDENIRYSQLTPMYPESK